MISRVLAAVAVVASFAAPVLAQDVSAAIAARKAHMGLYGFNLGILGGKKIQ